MDEQAAGAGPTNSAPEAGVAAGGDANAGAQHAGLAGAAAASATAPHPRLAEAAASGETPPLAGAGPTPDASASASAAESAAAAAEAAPTPVAAAAESPGGAEPLVRPADVCQRFGLSPYVLRGLLDEYGEWLPQVGGGLPPQTVGRLGEIVRWRADGVSPEAIRARLDDGQEAEEPFMELFGRMAELHATLSRSEEHRVQDRDRLMMALVRTQQEIRHLRQELSDRPSRRDRHRGLWRRLFGR